MTRVARVVSINTLALRLRVVAEGYATRPGRATTANATRGDTD